MSFHIVLTDPDVHPPSTELEAFLARCDGHLDARLCCSEAELRDFCAGADGVLCGRASITRKVVLAMPDCRIIARLGTGYDNVDLQSAGEAGIPVTNVPEFCTDDVAEHTWALILACCRRLVALAEETRRGVWRPGAVMPVYRLKGKILGVVGFGKIGRAVAERALAFGMRVVFFDLAYADSSRFESCKLQELFCQADIISLHLPLNEQTRGLIGKQAFDQMKPTAILINCARGAIVVEGELARVLREGRIAAAGLDTLAEEPPDPNNPLLQLPNAVITPHCAAHTVEALTDVRQQAYAEVARALRGEPLLHVVNQQHLNLKTTPLFE